MKRFLAVLLIALMTLSCLAGCGSTSTSSKEYNIAVLIPGSVAYFTATRAGSDEAAEKYGAKLTYSDANWDAATQLSQIEDAITQGVDMIAVCAADAEGILPGIEAANKAGVPILTFTNAIGSDESGTVDGVVSYIGQNEINTGKLCAEMAKKLLGDKGGKVVCIAGRPGTYCQIYRREGFLQGIEGTNIEVVYTQTANWEKSEAMSITEDLLQQKMDIDLFFCQDDGMAAGVGEVLVEQGVKDQYYVVGLGGSIAGLQALKDGTIDANTFLSAKEEGYKAIETCVKYLNGEEVDARTIVDQVEVTKDNVDSFKGEW